jgi:hypothetical protein
VTAASTASPSSRAAGRRLLIRATTISRGAPGRGDLPQPQRPHRPPAAAGEIARLAAGLPDAPIVIDEAYVDFGGLDVIPPPSR